MSNTKSEAIIQAIERRYTTKQMMKQFFKDGFVDRYSGRYLINPGILRIISAYRRSYLPCFTGGRDGEENWATTSMVNNLAKSNFTLEQLGWDLKNRGDLNEWDGLSKIFIDMIEHNQSYLKTKRIKEWYVATKEVMQKEKLL